MRIDQNKSGVIIDQNKSGGCLDRTLLQNDLFSHKTYAWQVLSFSYLSKSDVVGSIDFQYQIPCPSSIHYNGHHIRQSPLESYSIGYSDRLVIRQVSSAMFWYASTILESWLLSMSHIIWISVTVKCSQISTAKMLLIIVEIFSTKIPNTLAVLSLLRGLHRKPTRELIDRPEWE